MDVQFLFIYRTFFFSFLVGQPAIKHHDVDFKGLIGCYVLKTIRDHFSAYVEIGRRKGGWFKRLDNNSHPHPL